MGEDSNDNIFRKAELNVNDPKKDKLPKDDSMKANFWTNKTKENDTIKEIDSIKEDPKKANFWTSKTKKNETNKEFVLKKKDPKKADFWTSETKQNDTNTEIDLEKKDPKISNLKKKKDLNTKENDKVI